MTLAQLDSLAASALRADKAADEAERYGALDLAAWERDTADDLWRLLEIEASQPRDDLEAAGLL